MRIVKTPTRKWTIEIALRGPRQRLAEVLLDGAIWIIQRVAGPWSSK